MLRHKSQSARVNNNMPFLDWPWEVTGFVMTLGGLASTDVFSNERDLFDVLTSKAPDIVAKGIRVAILWLVIVGFCLFAYSVVTQAEDPFWVQVITVSVFVFLIYHHSSKLNSKDHKGITVAKRDKEV